MLHGVFDELVEAVHALADEVGVEVVAEYIFARKFELQLVVCRLLYLSIDIKQQRRQ